MRPRINQTRPTGSRNPPDKSRSPGRASGARSADPSEELLGQYFRDVAPIRVLGARQEGLCARRIEEATVAAWEQLLALPERVDGVLDAVHEALGDAHEELANELGPLRRAAKRCATRSAGSPGRGYAKHVRLAALRLREVDADARALLATLALIESGQTPLAPRPDAAPGPTQLSSDASFAKAARQSIEAAIARRNEFVSANLRLVIKIAKRYRNGSMPLVDLIQEGNLGLMEAVKRFDYRRGFRFSTYASWWIRHAICRAVAERGHLVRVPLHLTEARRRIGRARRTLGSRYGDIASLEEVAAESGIDVDKVKSVEAEMIPVEVRLDHEASEGLRFADLIADPDASVPLDEVVERDASLKAMQLVAELEPVEAEIIRRRFGIDGGEPQTLREIARDYNLSRERIRQIELKGLGRIRKRLLRRPIRVAQPAAATPPLQNHSASLGVDAGP